MKLSLTKIRSGVRVTRTDLPGDKHTHFANEETAKNFIRLIRKGIKPDNSRFQESARRVLTDKEYSELKPEGERKQRYYNKSGMNRRVI